MIYYIWALPSCVLFFILLSKLVVLNNEIKTTQIFIIYTIIRALPLLPIISRVSNRVLFDCMAYDILMFLVCAIAIGNFSNTGFKIMTTTNMIGFLLVCVGFVLMNIKTGV